MVAPHRHRSWWVVNSIYALTAGVVVAVVYYPQPLLTHVEGEFGVGPALAALTAAAAQLGYAFGALVLLPLAEIRRPRLFVSVHVVVVAALLALSALAPHLWSLCVILLVGGGSASIVQMLAPVATRTSAPEKHAMAAALIVAGLSSGIFMGRAAATFIAELFGWRWVYGLGAAAVLVIAVLLTWAMDGSLPAERQGSYFSSLTSMPQLLRRSRALRYACIMHFCVFSAFSAAWTAAAYHLQGPLGFGVVEAGLFALVGLVATVVVPFVGVAVKRYGFNAVRWAGLLLGATGAVVMLTAAQFAAGFAAAMVGISLCNFVVQVPNQVQIFAENGPASPRANAVYIFFLFTGGAMGAQLAPLAYAAGGAVGVGVYCLAMIAASGTATTVMAARGRQMPAVSELSVPSSGR